MIVYHTSYTVVKFPDTRYSREALDFGKGFYVTMLREQAVRYADKFTFRGKQAVLNIYELSDDWESNINVKHFTAYDEEWLDFVSANRKRLPVTLFDAVEGGVANDKVYFLECLRWKRKCLIIIRKLPNPDGRLGNFLLELRRLNSSYLRRHSTRNSGDSQL